MSQVAGLAFLCPQVSGISLKIPILSGFEVIQSNVQGVSENENAGNNRRLLTKIEDVCSEVLFRVWLLFSCGISGFC